MGESTGDDPPGWGVDRQIGFLIESVLTRRMCFPGMQVPFEGFVVPPAPHTVFLVVAVVAIVATLYSFRPPVTQKLVVAFGPWMVSGAALHVLYQLGERFQVWVYPQLLEPLFSAPAVYLTTFVGMGAVWVVVEVVDNTLKSAAEWHDYPARYLGASGTGVMLVLVGLVFWQGLDPLVGPLRPILPTIGLLVALVLTAAVYLLVGLWRTYVIAEARYVGALVLFAHAFDGVTTAVGVDLLGSGERSALPALIMDFAADLPTAQYVGSGWLFVVVKLAVAVLVVVLFADFVQDESTRGNLLFALVAAVGLGPGANNYLLFILGGVV